MTRPDAVSGPPNSLSVLARIAVDWRRGLLIALVVLLLIVAGRMVARVFGLYYGYIPLADERQAWSVLGMYGLLAQACILYGGQALWSPPARCAGALRNTRFGVWYGESRVIVGLRFCLMVAGFAVVAGVIIGANGVAVLRLASRLDETRFLAGVDELFYIGGSAIVAAAVAGIGLVAGVGRRRAALLMIVICWLLSVYTILLWGLLSALDAFIFNKRYDEFSSFQIFGWAGFLVTSAAMVRLLYLPEFGSGDAAWQPAESRYHAVSGNASLVSARGFSLVLLLTLFVSLDIGVDQASRLKLLQNARQIFATYYLQDIKRRPKANVIRDLPVVLGTPKTRERRVSRFLQSELVVGVVEMEQTNGETWRAEVISADRRGPDKEIDDEIVAKKELLAIAVRAGIEIGRDVTFYPLFRDVQRKLISEQKQVSLPLVGLPVAPDRIAWAIAAITLVILLLMRSRVRRIYLDPDLAIEQPWLVLDGQAGIERLAAMVWLSAVLLAPWLAHAALVVTFAVQIFAEGAPPDIPRESVAFGLMLILLLLSAWTATLTAADLYYLRRLRLHALGVTESAVGDA